ncbi:MAG TPA: LuxR C-terminal-related transcriptional regulator, partial [Dehalococcoidia bacterium]|nr:LuxR C-terminal-related transcriptional regulator [Dehalococcoidia bacterium]
THRQLEVMKQVALGATNKEISRRLYLSETTVKREIRTIFDKLDARDRAQAVSRAHEKGLL